MDPVIREAIDALLFFRHCAPSAQALQRCRQQQPETSSFDRSQCEAESAAYSACALANRCGTCCKRFVPYLIRMFRGLLSGTRY